VFIVLIYRPRNIFDGLGWEETAEEWQEKDSSQPSCGLLVALD